MARPTKAFWLWPWFCDDESPEVKSLRACTAAALPSDEVEAGWFWAAEDEEDPPKSKNWRWDSTAPGRSEC